MDENPPPIRRILLIGRNGNALEILEAAQEKFLISAILDDNDRYAGTSFHGIPVQPLNRLADHPDAEVVCLVGSDKSFLRRAGLIHRLALPRSRFATIVDPSARVSRFASIGCGVVIYAGVTVTSNAVIGDHVMILPHTVVHHDVTIGDHTVIGTHVTIAGGVRIGANAYIGSAVSLRGGISVGEGALVGMAANVVRDVAPGTIVVGNPAREIVRRGRPG